MSYILKELRLGDILEFEQVIDGKVRAFYPVIREVHNISDDVYILVTTLGNWILHHEGIKVTIVKEQP